MPSPLMSVVRTRIGLALFWFAAACTDAVGPEILAPETSCPGTQGVWSASQRGITVVMTLQQDGPHGWLGTEWRTWGTGRVLRSDDLTRLAEFSVGEELGRCLGPLNFHMTWPEPEELGPVRPLLARLNAGIAWEQGHRVIRGTVSLSGTTWTLGLHPLEGVDTLVFRLR